MNTVTSASLDHGPESSRQMGQGGPQAKKKLVFCKIRSLSLPHLFLRKGEVGWPDGFRFYDDLGQFLLVLLEVSCNFVTSLQ